MFRIRFPSDTVWKLVQARRLLEESPDLAASGPAYTRTLLGESKSGVQRPRRKDGKAEGQPGLCGDGRRTPTEHLPRDPPPPRAPQHS